MNIFSKEIKLALVGVLAIALLVVGINFLKGVNIFSPTNSYFVRFTDIQGLAVSTPVYANGYAVGNVRSIDYDYDRTDNVVVCIELDKSILAVCTSARSTNLRPCFPLWSACCQSSIPL